jgi:hypothetical protein
MAAQMLHSSITPLPLLSFRGNTAPGKAGRGAADGRKIKA